MRTVVAGGTYSVTFEEPQRAVAPGQVAAFYSGRRECLGDGGQMRGRGVGRPRMSGRRFSPGTTHTWRKDARSTHVWRPYFGGRHAGVDPKDHGHACVVPGEKR